MVIFGHLQLFSNLLFLCILKLLDEFSQTAVFETLTVSRRSSDCYHIICVFWRRTEPEVNH